MTKKNVFTRRFLGETNTYASKLFNELTNSAIYKYSRNFRACNGTDSRLTARDPKPEVVFLLSCLARDPYCSYWLRSLAYSPERNKP
jgi:hypothetical protein